MNSWRLQKGYRLAVYVAYSDEAAIAGSEGEFLVAGYVAAENEWPWLERAWQDRVLDGPPTIPYLHMVEIRGRPWRDEHGLSYYQGEQRVDEAIRVLYSTGSLFATFLLVSINPITLVSWASLELCSNSSKACCPTTTESIS
jgi:hypothetical protein